MTLEHAAAEGDIEEEQNRELLKGNSAILKQVEALEKRILELETSILAAIEKHGGPPSSWIEQHGAPPTGPIEPPTGG